MNNRNGIFGSMLSLGAVGAAVYGVARGMRNGTFQPLMNNIRMLFNGTTAQKIPQVGQRMMSEQGMMNEQGLKKITQPLKGMMNNQNNMQQAKKKNKQFPTS